MSSDDVKQVQVEPASEESEPSYIRAKLGNIGYVLFRKPEHLVMFTAWLGTFQDFRTVWKSVYPGKRPRRQDYLAAKRAAETELRAIGESTYLEDGRSLADALRSFAGIEKPS